MKRAWVSLLCLLAVLAVLTPVPSSAARPAARVAFVNAFPVRGLWEENVVEAMRDAAEDLGIDLTVYEAGEWPGVTLERVRALLKGPERPDYLVITLRRALGVQVLRLAEEARVPVFVINAGLSDEERARYGGPREHFDGWLGQMLPDDERAGYELAHRLLDEARAKGRRAPDGRIHLIALGGNPLSPSAVEREKGLRRAMAERGEAVLLQVVEANWSASEAERKAALLLRRYPDASVLWAANDAMALGALQAFRAQGLVPGSDIFVGGMNWEPRALEAVRGGEMVTTLDGHFLEGAWALVLLHDYHHGLDFARERVDWRSEMRPLTREDLTRHRPLLGDTRWDALDFRAFSKAENPDLGRYTFSLDAVLARLSGGAARRGAR